MRLPLIFPHPEQRHDTASQQASLIAADIAVARRSRRLSRCRSVAPSPCRAGCRTVALSRWQSHCRPVALAVDMRSPTRHVPAAAAAAAPCSVDRRSINCAFCHASGHLQCAGSPCFNTLAATGSQGQDMPPHCSALRRQTCKYRNRQRAGKLTRPVSWGVSSE